MNKIISALKAFVFGEEEKEEGYVHVVFEPDIEVRVRISKDSSKEQIKTIVNNAIDFSFAERKVELK